MSTYFKEKNVAVKADMIRNELRFQELISGSTDVLTIFASYIMAVYIRYYIMKSKPGLDTLSAPYLLIALAYSVIIASILGYVRKAGRAELESGMESSIFAINAVGCLFLLAFLYTIGEQYFSRWALVLFWLISSVFLILKNILLTLVFYKRQREYSRSIRVVVIGSGRNCGDYIRTIGFENIYDFTIVGYIGEKSHIFFNHRFEIDDGVGREDVAEERIDYKHTANVDEKGKEASTCGINSSGWLGEYSATEIILQRTMPDEVVFALEDGEIEVLEKLLPIVKKLGIKSYLIPDFGKYIPADATVEHIDGLRIIDLDGGQKEKMSGIYGLGLTLSSIFLILILIIKRFHIGNTGSLGLYETYRCFIFAMAGYFLFFSLRRFTKDKRYGNTIVALGSALISMTVILLYETAYTQGKTFARDTGLDLKMTLAVIMFCWGVKAVVDCISKDDYSIML